MPRLFLLDGTALAYRSHFALARSGLATADGRPTGAVYGFTTTLRRILEQEDPDLVAVALDPPGKTFRHERFAAYKATREKAPEEMMAQLDWIRAIVQAHGIPLYELPGYEADDVIGTLARAGEKAGYEVLIVTGDKDFMQLVGERIRLYNVFKQNEELVLQGAQEVLERFGTTPDRVIDVLALMGDTSDNIPGVKGIGEKGAVRLVQEFGSVANLLERLEEVKGKAREKIAAARAELLLSRELLTIDCCVPLDPPFEALARPEPDCERLLELFRRLEFRSLVDAIAAQTQRAFRHSPHDWCTIASREALEEMLGELRRAGRFALDVETDSLFPMQARLLGIAFATGERSWYVPFNADPPLVEGGASELLRLLEPVLTDPSLERTGQNTKHDWLVLARHGVRMPPPEFDTMVASFCASGAERGHGLDTLALHYFGLKKIDTKELVGRGKKQISMAAVPVERLSEYACEDAHVTWRLRQVLERELAESGTEALFRELEMPLVPVLTAMEERGIRLDVPLVEAMGASMERECQDLTWRIQELAGENLNVNSTKALGEALFEKLRIQDQAGVKRPKRTKTGWATDAATLASRYADVPIVAALLEYREIAKLKSTYVDALPRYVHPQTGRIHCSFSQTSAATGRLASSEPNLQNIPVRSERGRALRQAFVPRQADERGEWLLVCADYSQIELRLMAHLSGDPEMRRVFEEGRDVHTATASRIFGVPAEELTREMRSTAKVINFGLLYGMGPARVARETGLSLEEAREFVERYFRSFPSVRDWMDQLLFEARKKGYVETLLGRRRRIPEIDAKDSRLRAFAQNAAINTPVQGSAADVIKRAMIDLERELSRSKLAGRLLLQVHDELVLEAPAAELDPTRELVRRAMVEAVELEVPLAVEIGAGANWLEAH